MGTQKLSERLNEVFLGIALGYEVHGIEAMLNEVRALEDERDKLATFAERYSVKGDALRAQLAEVRLATLRQVHYLAKDNDGYILAEFIKECLIDAEVVK